MLGVFKSFQSQHEDFILDISYDFYGKRLATCSSDQRIKIFNQSDKGDWTLAAEIKAHSGTVNKVSWAHPEFGPVLASCSVDRVVNIYQELVDSVHHQHTWSNVCHLVDSRDSVVDVKFAPRHLGLKLASCSADGTIRIYEAQDIMNLTNWSVSEEFEVKKDCSCISWNQSPFEAPTMVVGGGHQANIWEFQEKVRKWQCVLDLEGHGSTVHDVSWAPNLGRTYHLVATALLVHSGKHQQELLAELARPGPPSELWRVEWNISGTMLASTGDDGQVCVWRQDARGMWAFSNAISGQRHAASKSGVTEE